MEKDDFIKKYHPMASTPGRMQYYRAEMDPFLPDEYKWGLRLPSEIAAPKQKATYRNSVEQEVQRFLSEKVGAHYFDHEAGLNLNMTVQEAEFLVESSRQLKGAADSGELHQILKECAEQEARLTAQFDEVHEYLDSVVQQINASENQVYAGLQKHGVTGFQSHGESSVFDLFGQSTGDNSANNLQVCVNQAHGFDHHTQASVNTQLSKLVGFLRVKQSIYAARVQLLEELVERVLEGNSHVDRDLAEVRRVHDEIVSVLAANPDDNKDSESQAFADSFKEYFNGPVVELLDTLVQHEAAHNRRDILHNRAHLHSESEGLFNFRDGVMHHLAASIYVKEHRLRYQQEQFERLARTLRESSLANPKQTLKEFCRAYAEKIETLIDESHNFKSPKIEANYSAYDESRVRPINATIFYYFFSLEKAKRYWARAFLSAAQYPNDRLRAAYLKFFTA